MDEKLQERIDLKKNSDDENQGLEQDVEVLDNGKKLKGDPKKVNPNQPNRQNPGRSQFNEFVLEDIHRKGKRGHRWES